MLTEVYDWSNHSVIYYELSFSIVNTSFIPELENTSSDTYRWYNETLNALVSGVISVLKIINSLLLILTQFGKCNSYFNFHFSFTT